MERPVFSIERGESLFSPMFAFSEIKVVNVQLARSNPPIIHIADEMPRWLRGSERSPMDIDPEASRDSLSSADPAGVESLDDWDDDESGEGDDAPDDLERSEWIAEPSDDKETSEMGQAEMAPFATLRPDSKNASSSMSRSVNGDSDAEDIVLVPRTPPRQSEASPSSFGQRLSLGGDADRIPTRKSQDCLMESERDRDSSWEPLEASSLPLREWPSPSHGRDEISRDDKEEDFGSSLLSESEITIAKRNRR
jgi:hypothetical protein